MGKLIPLHNHVLVKRAKTEEKTPSGLVIPTTEKSQEGEVLAIGPGKTTDVGKLIPMTVKPGDVVMFEKHAGTEIKLDGETFLLMSEDSIIGVIEK